MRGLPRQIVVVLSVVVNLVLNGLAGAGLLFGVQTGAVSDAVPTGVTPAGWTFGIWTVIFLMLVLYAGFQALPALRSSTAGRFFLAGVNAAEMTTLAFEALAGLAPGWAIAGSTEMRAVCLAAAAVSLLGPAAEEEPEEPATAAARTRADNAAEAAGRR